MFLQNGELGSCFEYVHEQDLLWTGMPDSQGISIQGKPVIE